MMGDDWGTPDWTNADAYEVGTQWGRNRWRWEFLRRRDDLRREFDAKAPAAYGRLLERFKRHPENFGYEAPRAPSCAGFHVSSLRIAPDHPLAQPLPNPRIGDQPDHAIAWTDWPDGWTQHEGSEPEGFARFDFDLTQPIEPQLVTARAVLKEFQAEHFGKPIVRRVRPDKWPTYLRILDARAAGCSWSKIAAINPGTKGDAQAARDAWEQARALCFKF